MYNVIKSADYISNKSDNKHKNIKKSAIKNQFCRHPLFVCDVNMQR